MRPTVVLASLLCMLTGRLANAQERPVTSQVSGKVKVVAESSFRGQDLVKKSLGQYDRVSDAVRKVAPDLKVTQPLGQLVRVTFEPGIDVELPQILVLNFKVESFDARVDAKAVLDVLGKRLEQELSNLDVDFQLNETRLRRENSDVSLLADGLKLAQEQFAHRCAALGVDMDAAAEAQRRLQMETQAQQLTVELRGLEAREAVIQVQIAKYAQAADKLEGADAVVLKELEKSVAARRKIVEYREAMVAAASVGGTITMEDLEKAKDSLAQAEAELARHRRALVEGAGGQRVDELRRRLDDTIIEREELAAKLKVVKDGLLQRSRDSDIELSRIRLELLRDEYRERVAHFNELKASLDRHIRPTVEIIPDEPAEKREPAETPAK